MYRWLNHSHPQTLQGAVILGYFTAVFALLGAGPGIVLALLIGGGAFLTANDKRIGWYMLLASTGLLTALYLLGILSAFVDGSLIGALFTLNQSIFTIGVFALAVHGDSRNYQKIWFA